MTDTRESLGLDWRFSASDSVIMDSAHRLMVDVSGLTHEEAAFIVTACNAHHDLVDAGEALLASAEAHIFSNECQAERDAFRAALLKAKGGAS